MQNNADDDPVLNHLALMSTITANNNGHRATGTDGVPRLRAIPPLQLASDDDTTQPISVPIREIQ